MRKLASLTAADFEPAVESVFAIVDEPSAPLELRLTEVTSLGERPGHRRPFSLRLRGPLTPALGQGTRRLLHPDMGELEIFLVPTASDADGMSYQAVFA